MPEIEYKYISLEDLFNLSITSNGSALTKSFVDKNKGEIPVYGSTMDEDDISYGHIADNLSGIKYFSDCLTINRNGSAGYLFFRKGRFTINSDVTPLILRKKYMTTVDLQYIKYALQPITIKKFSHIKKAGKHQLAKITIPIPVTVDGEFDIQIQKELAKRYEDVEKKRKALINCVQSLDSVRIDISETARFQEIMITDLFTPKGGSMLLSKEYCKKHEGSYPVYSGSTVAKTFASLDHYDYDGEYLTWVIDGLAGYAMILNGKFSITCHRGILLPTDRCQNIDLQYVKYMIEPIFRRRKRGRMGINGKNEYTALKPTHIKNYNDTIKIPIKEDGSFDLEKQREIAKKHATVESIKRDLYNQILELTSIIIT